MTNSKQLSRRRFLGNLGAASVVGGVIGGVVGAARTEEVPSSAPPADAASSSAPPCAHNYLDSVLNPSFVDERIDSRSITPENRTGERGGGGMSMRVDGGRKGKSSGRWIAVGERIVLADIKGPGTLRHIWMALDWYRPEYIRAFRFEVFYDGMTEPSISVPLCDFFGLPHGRPAEFYSQLMTVPDGVGVNSYIPMPFGRSVRIELTNENEKFTGHPYGESYGFSYQIDYTLEPLVPERTHYLHASFRRENPTTLRRDFVVTEGLKGPGRFLGCVVGIRPLNKIPKWYGWYGEGQIKFYRDGDGDYPTINGTGLEDYACSAYGLGRHYGPYSGAPLWQFAPDAEKGRLIPPDLVSFYRWHVPDPIMFSKDLRVTLQQIGMTHKELKSKEELERYKATHLPASTKDWVAAGELQLDGLVERQDDYCATAFVYCRTPQPVPRLNIKLATANVAWMPYEGPTWR